MEINEKVVLQIELSGLGNLAKNLILHGGMGVMTLEKEKSLMILSSFFLTRY